MLSVPEGKKLFDIPYFKDGAIIKVSSRNPKKPVTHGVGVDEMQYLIPYLRFTKNSKCNHPPGGKCLNCISTT